MALRFVETGIHAMDDLEWLGRFVLTFVQSGDILIYGVKILFGLGRGTCLMGPKVRTKPGKGTYAGKKSHKTLRRGFILEKGCIKCHFRVLWGRKLG